MIRSLFRVFGIALLIIAAFLAAVLPAEASWQSRDSNYNVAIRTAGTWDPSQFTSTVLLGWLKDAQQFHTGTTQATNGQTVATWSDQSGNGNNFVQSASGPTFDPIYNTNVLNSKGCVLFGPGTANGSQGTVLNSSLNISQPDTVFAVVIPASSQTITFAHWLDSAAGTGSRQIFAPVNGSSNYSTQGFIFAGTVVNSGTFSNAGHIHGGVFNGASSVTSLDGTATTAVSPGAAGLVNASIGGGSSAGGTGYDGYVCELVITNTAVATSDRQKIEGYLAWQWGLQGNLPGGHPYASSPP